MRREGVQELLAWSPVDQAVAAALLRAGVTPKFRQVALPDEFLDAGALPTLHDRYGISTAKMVEKIKYRLR